MTTPIDDVLTFWFGSAPATNASEFGVKMKRWYLGGEGEDAAIGSGSRSRSRWRSAAGWTTGRRRCAVASLSFSSSIR